MKLNREQKAGLLFGLTAAGLLLLIAGVLSASGSRSLRFTAVFNDAKGLKPGDVVRMSGVDVGEVASVELSTRGGRVSVGMKISEPHREKVQANAAAYIADSSFPNVSGQMVVEIHNSPASAPPMANNRVIQGKNNLFELKAWEISEKASVWGNSIAEASKDAAAGAGKFAGGVKEAGKNLAAGAAKKLREAFKGGGGPEASPAPDAAPEPGGAGELPKADPEPREEPRVLEPPPGGTGQLAPAESAEASEMFKELMALLAEMGRKGQAGAAELLRRWNDLKSELAPMIEKWAAAGKEWLAERFQALMDEIEREMEELERARPPARGLAEGEVEV